MSLRIGLFQIQAQPRKSNREGYIRPELQDLAVLADLLDDPAFPTFEVVERAVCHHLGLEVPKTLVPPPEMQRDLKRAQRFRREPPVPFQQDQLLLDMLTDPATLTEAERRERDERMYWAWMS